MPGTDTGEFFADLSKSSTAARHGGVEREQARRQRLADESPTDPGAHHEHHHHSPGHHGQRRDDHLTHALALGAIGPYQLQAAIQSVHNRRAATGTTDWAAIAALHDGLQHLAPSVGGAGERAAASHLHAVGPDAAVTALEQLDRSSVEQYRRYWVTAAQIAAERGDVTRADECLCQAIALTNAPHTTRHLEQRRASLGASPSA